MTFAYFFTRTNRLRLDCFITHKKYIFTCRCTFFIENRQQRFYFSSKNGYSWVKHCEIEEGKGLGYRKGEKGGGGGGGQRTLGSVPASVTMLT